MGLEKVGINVGKKIIAWAKTGKSPLAARPVIINTQSLKYVPAIEKDLLKLSDEQELCKFAEQVLGRDLNMTALDNVIDFEHSLPGASWNGTINCINDAIRHNMYVDIQVINKIDSLMQSAKRTTFDAIAYRGESYIEGDKHLTKILNLKPGDKFTDDTYRYITGDKEYADHFRGMYPIKVKYNYILPKDSVCIWTKEKECALLPKETFSEIISIDKSDPYNIVINAILRTP